MSNSQNIENESGYYYIVVKQVEFPNRIDFYNSSATVWSYHSKDCIEEVLAPVPSYEEWQKLKEFADYSLHNRDELIRQMNLWSELYLKKAKENQQLKELLKECKFYIGYDTYEFDEKVNKLITKIDNAIGEKK